MKDLTKCYCGHTTTCDCGPEVPKQETLEEVAEKYVDSFEYGIAHPRRVAKNAFINGAKWQQERSYSERDLIKCYCGHTTTCDCGPEQDFKDIELPQQERPETLEEVAEIWVHNRFTKQIKDEDIYASESSIVQSHILFAKWQQERSYSEEEVLELLKEVRKGSMITSSINNRTYWEFDIKSENKWFEQFKKK